MFPGFFGGLGAGGKGKKGKKGRQDSKKEAVKPADQRLTHTLDMISAFSSLKVCLPLCCGQSAVSVPVCLSAWPKMRKGQGKNLKIICFLNAACISVKARFHAASLPFKDCLLNVL